jgi:hypothetical protein
MEPRNFLAECFPVRRFVPANAGTTEGASATTNPNLDNVVPKDHLLQGMSVFVTGVLAGAMETPLLGLEDPR